MPAPHQRLLLKPPPLRPGDTIGIIAPASNVHAEALERGCEALRGLGYKPFYFDSILERELYFAGRVQRRIVELHEMFERDDVRAILCARGGYGCNYLLEHLDLDLVRKHPKILCGYSDITALLTYLYDSTGVVTFHGPMVASDFSTPLRGAGSLWPEGIHPYSWQVMLSGGPGDPVMLGEPSDDGMIGLIDGNAHGRLYGGCLSILVASLGTPYEIQPPDGAILFLEDMGEKPFRIDRMLMQLSMAKKFDGVGGFVFGEMRECVQPGGQGYTLQDVITRVIRERCPGVPVASGLRSGHVSRSNITLPIGWEANLRVEGGKADLHFHGSPTLAGEIPAPPQGRPQ
jgi:muramoyltetrapeptide carboxypeptidase